MFPKDSVIIFLKEMQFLFKDRASIKRAKKRHLWKAFKAGKIILAPAFTSSFIAH